MSRDNVLKDPDFLFTLLAALMKRDGGKIELTEDDVLAVDMDEAVGLHYDRENSVITLRFVTAKELALRYTEPTDPPRLKLVPEFEDGDEQCVYNVCMLKSNRLHNHSRQKQQERKCTSTMRN